MYDKEKLMEAFIKVRGCPQNVPDRLAAFSAGAEALIDFLNVSEAALMRQQAAQQVIDGKKEEGRQPQVAAASANDDTGIDDAAAEKRANIVELRKDAGLPQGSDEE